jgi:tmRNA-binding protein
MSGAVERDGMTIVPLKLYFNKGTRQGRLAIARQRELPISGNRRKRSWDRSAGGSAPGVTP